MDPNTDEETQIQKVVEETGLSEEEARQVLFGAPQEPAPGSVESNLNFLAESFPEISLGDRKSVLMDCENNLELAVEQLLNFEILNSEQGDNPQLFFRQQKKAMKDARKTNKTQSKYAKQSDQDVDLVAKVLGIDSTVAQSLYDTWDHNVSKAIMHGSSHLIDMRSVDRALAEYGYSTYPPSDSAITGNGPTSDSTLSKLSTRELRTELHRTQLRLRSEVERAAKYRKDPLQRPIASEAARSAFDTRKQLQEIEQYLVASNQENQVRGGVMDLHGLEVRPAEILVRKCLEEYKSIQDTGVPSFEIITGAGIHSQGGVPILKNMTRRVLDEQNWKYTELQGSFIVLHPFRR